MDSPISLQHRAPAAGRWRGIVWRLAIACLLGSLALMPYVLQLFYPDVGTFLTSISVFDPVGRVFYFIYPALFAEGALTLVMLLNLLLDRRIPRRWTALTCAGLLLLAVLVALDGFLLAQAFVNVGFIAAGPRIVFGISLDFYPFFFAAIAAAFVLGEQARGASKRQAAAFFILLGVVAVAGGMALDALISLIPQGQGIIGFTTLLADSLSFTVPVLLLMGILGGLFGGYLRSALTYLFSPTPESGAGSSGENETAAPQAPLFAFLWGVVWRWGLAAAVGALAGRSTFHIVATFYVNRPLPSEITSSPITDLLVVLLPLALLLLGLLAQRDFQQSRAIGWSTWISLLFFLLIIGLEDALSVSFNIFGFRFGSDVSIVLLMYVIKAFSGVLALVIVTTFALGSMNQMARRASLLWLLLASIGIAVFLSALPEALPPLEEVSNNWSIYFPSVNLVMTYVIGGFLLAVVGGLLGGWLHSKARVWVARLDQSTHVLPS